MSSQEVSENLFPLQYFSKILQLQPPKNIAIVEDGNLILNFYQPNDRTLNEFYTGAQNKRIAGKLLAMMRVSRDVLVKNSIKYKSELVKPVYEEATPSVVDCPVDSIEGYEVVFRAIHDTINDTVCNIPIKEIWEILEVLRYLIIDPNKLNTWFARWLEAKDKSDFTNTDEGHSEMMQLLTPCWTFNHSRCMAYISKRLVLEVGGHIMEENPSDYEHHHLPHTVISKSHLPIHKLTCLIISEIDSLNGARGSLRLKLLQDFDKNSAPFLNSACTCSGNSLKAYMKALEETGLWPMISLSKHSINDILANPGVTQLKVDMPENACLSCKHNMRPDTLAKVQEKWIAAKTSWDRRFKYWRFEGLCLDCMNKSMATKSKKPGSTDVDYWKHDLYENWSSGCRFQHGQPTWYWSFMGRQTNMTTFQELREKRQKELGVRH